MSASGVADGFHPLQSLAVFTDLGDELEAEAADDLSLSLAGPFAAGLSDADNLVLKAARLLAERAGRPAEAKFTLTKNLPVASGIGGGSADAAAALRALIDLWQLKLEDSVVGEIAAALGSDVPVCLKSVPAFMEGRGEILAPLTVLPRLPLLLVNPGVAVSTRDIFAALSDRRGTGLQSAEGRLRRCGGSAAVPGSHRQRSGSAGAEAPARDRRRADGAGRNPRKPVRAHVGLAAPPVLRFFPTMTLASGRR